MLYKLGKSWTRMIYYTRSSGLEVDNAKIIFTLVPYILLVVEVVMLVQVVGCLCVCKCVPEVCFL